MNWIIEIGRGFLQTLLEVAPYLLLGFLVAGLLSVWLSPETVERHLGRGRFWPVIKASLFGVPMPLCSCGVIPVAASLRRHGANRGATTAFLISTPQTGVDNILVTYGLLGTVFAAFTPVATFLSGVAGGLAVNLLNPDRMESPGHPAPVPPDCCGHGHKKSWSHALFHGFVILPRELAHPLLLGLLIAGLISALVPPDFLAGNLGHGFSAKLIMLVVGIPIYVCATASLPVAAALIASGLSPGAALVFLMSGPATNAATIATVWKIMGRRTALIYLAAVAVSALVCGVLLDAVYTATGQAATHPDHEMLPGFVRMACAVILVVVLLSARYGRWGARGEEGSAETSK